MKVFRLKHPSFSLLHEGEDNGLQRIVVTSDRRKSKELLEIAAVEIANAFNRVGNDDVVAMDERFDEGKGDWAFSRR